MTSVTGERLEAQVRADRAEALVNFLYSQLDALQLGLKEVETDILKAEIILLGRGDDISTGPALVYISRALHLLETKLIERE